MEIVIETRRDLNRNDAWELNSKLQRDWKNKNRTLITDLTSKYLQKPLRLRTFASLR